MSFTPLRVRSHGSLLHGVASPEALIDRALALGYRALALTDRDNLYLAIRFYQRARAEGLAPLLGAEITSPAGHALLLPVDRRGFGNLGRLLTDRHLDPAFDLVAALGQHSAGLHVIVESPGLAASLLAAGVRAAAGEVPGRAAEPRAAPGGLWLGVRGIARERVRIGERLAAARRLAIPPVATGDVLLLAAGDHDTHRAAVTAAAGELEGRMPPSAFEADDAVLAAPEPRPTVGMPRPRANWTMSATSRK
jgi:DNA polymerase III alpha subunit